MPPAFRPTINTSDPSFRSTPSASDLNPAKPSTSQPSVLSNVAGFFQQGPKSGEAYWVCCSYKTKGPLIPGSSTALPSVPCKKQMIFAREKCFECADKKCEGCKEVAADPSEKARSEWKE